MAGRRPALRRTTQPHAHRCPGETRECDGIDLRRVGGREVVGRAVVAAIGSLAAWAAAPYPTPIHRAVFTSPVAMEQQ